jgi:penicillin-binding protein 2
VVVAGKTGTAQATDRGKKDDIAWFSFFAPYDKPRYVIVVMVQSGMHGGSVAAPVAARILEQCIAMDQGSYTPELASLTPAHGEHPFATIAAIDYKNTEKLAIVEESSADHASDAKVEMGSKNGAHPDLKSAPDKRGTVQKKNGATASAPTPKPVDNRNFFQRLFGAKPSNPSPRPPPGPPARPGH